MAVKALDDPIRMYFSQMASIPLLTREEEIHFAKEIEKNQKKLGRNIFMTALGQDETLQLLGQINNGTRLVEKSLDLTLSRKGDRQTFFDRLEKELPRMQQHRKHSSWPTHSGRPESHPNLTTHWRGETEETTLENHRKPWKTMKKM